MSIPNKWIPLNAVDISTGATIWTPSTGRLFRLLSYSLRASVAGNILLQSVETATGGLTKDLIIIPSAAGGSAPYVPLGKRGVDGSYTGSILKASGIAGTISGWIAGVEDPGSTAPAPPTVTDIAPTTGAAAGSTPFTLTGTNFAAGATVKFGTTLATGIVVVSSTSITGVTPAHLAGAVDVVVTNLDGRTGTLPAGFTYV